MAPEGEPKRVKSTKLHTCVSDSSVGASSHLEGDHVGAGSGEAAAGPPEADRSKPRLPIGQSRRLVIAKADKTSSQTILQPMGGTRVNQEKSRMERMLEHMYVTVFMMLVTVYALFGDDLRLALSSVTADPVFTGCTCAALGLYVIELVLNTAFKKDYAFNFYFWLDIIRSVWGGAGRLDSAGEDAALRSASDCL